MFVLQTSTATFALLDIGYLFSFYVIVEKFSMKPSVVDDDDAYGLRTLKVSDVVAYSRN